MSNSEKKTECSIIENGPLVIKGDFKIMDAKGNEVSATDPAFICRCGHSDNKPFCDGKHRDEGFSG